MSRASAAAARSARIFALSSSDKSLSYIGAGVLSSSVAAGIGLSWYLASSSADPSRCPYSKIVRQSDEYFEWITGTLIYNKIIVHYLTLKNLRRTTLRIQSLALRGFWTATVPHNQCVGESVCRYVTMNDLGLTKPPKMRENKLEGQIFKHETKTASNKNKKQHSKVCILLYLQFLTLHTLIGIVQDCKDLCPSIFPTLSWPARYTLSNASAVYFTDEDDMGLNASEHTPALKTISSRA